MGNNCIMVLIIAIIVFVIVGVTILIIRKKDTFQQDPIEKAENDKLAAEAKELGKGFKD